MTANDLRSDSAFRQNRSSESEEALRLGFRHPKDLPVYGQLIVKRHMGFEKVLGRIFSIENCQKSAIFFVNSPAIWPGVVCKER